MAIELQTKVREDLTITEKAPTMAFWLKVPTSAFTFEPPLRHYVKQALKLGKKT